MKQLANRIKTLEQKQEKDHKRSQPTKTLADFYRLCKIPGTEEYESLNRLYDPNRKGTP